MIVCKGSFGNPAGFRCVLETEKKKGLEVRAGVITAAQPEILGWNGNPAFSIAVGVPEMERVRMLETESQTRPKSLKNIMVEELFAVRSRFKLRGSLLWCSGVEIGIGIGIGIGAMPPTSIIEHLLLFKLRDSTHPSQISAMLSSQRSLSSLQLIPHLAAGPIHRHRHQASPAADFTHLLHIRFLSKPDLAAYTLHPSHVAVVRHNAPIVADIIAVDWIADLDGDIVPAPGTAMRFLIAKPREGIPAEEVVKTIDGVSASKVTSGVNFSRDRAKGYEVGLVLGFSGVKDMEGAEGEEEIVEIEDSIRDLVESVIVVDFVVPSVGL